MDADFRSRWQRTVIYAAYTVFQLEPSKPANPHLRDPGVRQCTADKVMYFTHLVSPLSFHLLVIVT